MVILLSAIVGFSACSQGDGSASGKVSPNSEKIIGNAKWDEVEIITPAVTFYNTVNGNYFAMELTVGGLIPRGSENGDKVYIIVVFNGSLATYIETAYEYEWV